MYFWLSLLGLAGLVVLIAVIWYVRLVRSTEYTARQTFFWLFARFLTRVFWRTRISGPFPLPAEGGAVVICNHRSSVDPFFIQVSVKRVIHWMVAREYCEHPVFGYFLKIAEVIPVNRGGIDTASTKSAIRIVSEGGIVGMLPEGRINTTSKFMNPVRPGAVIVALRGQVPIIPCYIQDAPYNGKVWSPFVMRARTRVVYGEPIDLSAFYGQHKDEMVVRQLLVDVVTEIARLAGRDDFAPELAGRKWKPETAEDETAEGEKPPGENPPVDSSSA